MEVPVYHLEHVVQAKEDMEDFNGPLDLILYLLSKNKMQIQDIQISVILDQYMAWMDRRKELDLEVASEFIAMAAQLTYIKTRMLLSIRDEEALSEMEQLIASLEEHQRHENYDRLKQVVPLLDQRFRIGRDYLTRGPAPLPKETGYRYLHKSTDLQAAMREIFQRTDTAAPPPMAAFDGIVGREPYPVQDKAKELFLRIVKNGVMRFRALFQGSRSRSEIVATFLAVLELCRNKRVHLAGTEDNCTVTGETDQTEYTDITPDTY